MEASKQLRVCMTKGGDGGYAIKDAICFAGTKLWKKGFWGNKKEEGYRGGVLRKEQTIGYNQKEMVKKRWATCFFLVISKYCDSTQSFWSWGFAARTIVLYFFTPFSPNGIRLRC